MKVVVFSPYGEHTPGQGTIYMLLRYLQSFCADITQLHCNGAFSVCERDVAFPEGRTIEHCLRCSSEQREQAQFAGATVQRLTEYLNPEDLERTRRWVLERDADVLWDEVWYGFQLSELISETFHRMTGESQPRFNSQKHAAMVRRLSLVAVRMAVAMGRCVNRERPDWVWMPAGQEILSKTAYFASQEGAGAVARFQPAPDEQMILVYREGDSHPYRLQNVVSSVRDVRTDIDSWPKDVISEFDDFLNYLGITVSQLGLPVAR